MENLDWSNPLEPVQNDELRSSILVGVHRGHGVSDTSGVRCSHRSEVEFVVQEQDVIRIGPKRGIRQDCIEIQITVAVCITKIDRSSPSSSACASRRCPSSRRKNARPCAR